MATIHRHKNSAGNYVTISDGKHDHPDYAKRIGDLETMVARLTPLLTFLPIGGPDTIPPVLGGITVSALTSTTATVFWMTNEPATGQVNYGTTGGYGSSTTLQSTLTLGHTAEITGLPPSTLHHYRVRSTDAAGNETVGSDATFTTTAADPPPPPETGTYLDMIAARSGVLAAFFFGDDSGGTFLDRGPLGNNGTWTGTPTLSTTSPIPSDTKTAVTLGATDVGTVPHISQYDRGDGPFSLEFWTNAHDASSHELVSESNHSSDGWMIRTSLSLVRLADWDGGANIRQTTAASAGWHHFVLTRGSGVDGKVYVDGVDATTVSNTKTFPSSAADFLVTVNGGIYGLVFYDREVTQAEALASATYTYGAVVPPPSTTVVQGFGSQALVGSRTTFHVTTLALSGPGSILDALSVNNRDIVFDVAGTINLGAQVNYIDGRSNFNLDGGGFITFVNGPLYFRNCGNFVVKNLRHRGGWAGGQAGDNFSNVGCHDFAYLNVSTSNSSDENISSTGGCTNYTIQDCLFGQSADYVDGVEGHNYASLNYGWTAGWNGPGSFVRNAFINKYYRNPKCGYRNDSGADSSTPDPNPISYDVVNNICVNVHYSLTAEYGAKVNEINSYNSDSDLGSDASTGAVIGTGYTVPAWAQVTALTATAAKDNAKINCGCLPHDAFDTALLAQIP